jgi:putative glycosyltransferase (TIGR04348 family)
MHLKPSIEIVTPAPAGSLHGNRITALRWQGFLEKLAYKTSVTESWSGKEVNVLIALHGLRSYASIANFKKAYPHHPIILILTGTDIHRDLGDSPQVAESMEIADAIVILQPAALTALPKCFHYKVHLIYQSVKVTTRKPLLKRDFLVSLIGHLRPEKDPFCSVLSLQYLNSASKLKLVHLGKAMSITMEKEAQSHAKKQARYHWLGECSHAHTMRWLARSNLMVISSLMEGGAHVVSEAIAIGVPVIASDIPGNRGLLGNNYPAYFPVGDAQALGRLLTKAEFDPTFYHKLERAITARQRITLPTLEQRSIQKLLQSLLQ